MNKLNGKRDIVKDIRFSIIVSKSENVPIDCLFENTDEDSELIIVDKVFDSDTRKDLRERKGYKQIKYIKPHTHHHRMINQGLSTSLNSGILVSSNEYLILLRNALEFKDNYFDTLREDIKSFAEAFQHQNFIIIGNDRRESDYIQEEKWQNTFNFQSRFIELGDHDAFKIENIGTLYTLTLPKNDAIEINGFDERYDNGVGYHLENFLFRQHISNMHEVRDRFLMTSVPTISDTEPTLDEHKYFTLLKTNNPLWNYDKIEIRNGKMFAFNFFNMKSLLR